MKKYDNKQGDDHKIRTFINQYMSMECQANDDGLVTILTNLQDHWQFFWCCGDGSQLVTCITAKPSHASYLLMSHIHHNNNRDVGLEASLSDDFLNPGTWDAIKHYERSHNNALENISEEHGGDNNGGGMAGRFFDPNAATPAMDIAIAIAIAAVPAKSGS